MNWGPLEDKSSHGPSMTRLVALVFTLVYCTVMILAQDTVVGMGWPFASLGIVVVLAVPLQALFKSLQSWLATPPGKKLIEIALSKVASTAGIQTSGMTTETTTKTGPADVPSSSSGVG